MIQYRSYLVLFIHSIAAVISWSQSPSVYYKCAGESTIINDVTYTEAGVYTVIFVDQNGADSTGYIEVIDHPAYTTTLLKEICPGDLIDGISYTHDTTIVMQYETMYGCDSIVSLDIDVIAIPDLQFSGDTHLCPGDSTIISVGNYDSYLWSNDQTTQGISVSDEGSYVVTVTNAFGCESTDSVLVTQSAFDLIPEVGHVACRDKLDGSIHIQGSSTLPITSYIISNDVESLESLEPYIEGLSSGVYTVIAADSYACRDTIEVEITQPEATFEATIDPLTSSPLSGESVKLSFTSNHTIDKVSWYSDDWHSSEERCDCVFDESAILYLELTDDYGCAMTDSIFIHIEDYELVMANAFRPESTSENNAWRIGDYEHIDHVHSASIIDRWGNVVHQQLDAPPEEIIWDGSAHGNQVATGVYILQLHYEYKNRDYRKISTINKL